MRIFKKYAFLVFILCVFIVMVYVKPFLIVICLVGTFLVFIFALYLFFIWVFIESILKPWKKASKNELFREDEVLIESVGFIQAIISIFISGTSTQLVSIIIIFTVVFFVFRAYAHIKNLSIWRLMSNHVLLAMILYEVPLASGFSIFNLFDFKFLSLSSNFSILFSFIPIFLWLAFVSTGMLFWVRLTQLFEMRYDLTSEYPKWMSRPSLIYAIGFLSTVIALVLITS